MADDRVIIEVDLETAKAIQKIAKFTSKAKKAGKKTGQAFEEGFTSSIALDVALGGLLVQAFNKSLQTIKSTITGVAGAAQQLEVFEVQFKTILGSSKAAQKQLEDLQKFAATTPFKLPGIALATRQLLSFGVEQEKIIPTLRQLGDLAAGTGSSIDELTIPFGRLQSTQKLTLIELDKFADRGINLYQKLADQTGISIKIIRDEISKGNVPFEEFTKALNSLTRQGGIFFNATQAQSKTLDGVISTLQDNIFNFAASVGKAFSPALVKGVEVFTGVIQDLNAEIGKTKFEINTDSLVNGLIVVSRAVNDYIIAPFELVFNVAKVVFGGINTFVAGLVAGIGKLAEKMSGLAKLVGLGDISQNLKDFSDTSFQVFEDNAKATRDSLDAIFDGSIYGKTDSFISNIQEKLNAQKALTESVNQATTTGDGVGSPLGQMANDAVTFGAVFEALPAQIEAGAVKINKSMSKMQQAVGTLSNTILKGIGQGTANAFAAFGSALAKGENAFDAFVKSFLASLGQMMIQQGSAFMLQGLGFSVIPGLQASGGTLIAAGAGLAALGGVLTAIGGGGGATAGASAGGGAPIEGTGTSTIGTDLATTAERQDPQKQVQVVINGPVMDGQESGLRIIELIEEAGFNADAKVLA